MASNWDLLRRITSAAVPLSGVFLADIAMEATNTAVVGRLGAEAIATVGIGGTFVVVYASFCMSMPSVPGALMADAHARQDMPRVASIVQHGLLVGVLYSLPTFLIALVVEPILRWMGQPIAVAENARIYALVLSLAVFPWIAFSVLDYFVTVFDRPVIATAFAGLGVILNLVISLVLTFGYFGFPSMGIVGAALATVVVSILMLVGLALTVSLSPNFSCCRPFESWSGSNRTLTREILALSIPRSLAGAGDVLYASLLALLLSRIDLNLVAASQLALSVVEIYFAVVSGIGMAMSTQVAHLRVTSPAAVRRVFVLSIAMVFCGLAVLLTASLAWPREIVSIYLDLNNAENQPAIAWASLVLCLVIVNRFPRAVALLGLRGLTGLMDGGRPFHLFMLMQWLLALPIGLLLMSYSGMGVVGLYIGEFLGIGLAAVFIVKRFWLLSRCKEDEGIITGAV